jgi:hypothetical protein
VLYVLSKYILTYYMTLIFKEMTIKSTMEGSNSLPHLVNVRSKNLLLGVPYRFTSIGLKLTIEL